MYIEVADIKAIMRTLPSSSKLSDEDIQQFIETAEAHVDSFLSDTYEVPFLNPPRIIKKITADLTVYFLTEALYTSFQPNSQEGNQTRYDRSMETLKSIRNGDIVLAGITPKLPFDQIGFASTFDGEIFFTIDPDKEW